MNVVGMPSNYGAMCQAIETKERDMTAPFTKKELQALIESADEKIAALKTTLTPTIEEDAQNQVELQKLNAARSELLEKMKVAP